MDYAVTSILWLSMSSNVVNRLVTRAFKIHENRVSNIQHCVLTHDKLLCIHDTLIATTANNARWMTRLFNLSIAELIALRMI